MELTEEKIAAIIRQIPVPIPILPLGGGEHEIVIPAATVSYVCKDWLEQHAELEKLRVDIIACETAQTWDAVAIHQIIDVCKKAGWEPDRRRHESHGYDLASFITTLNEEKELSDEAANGYHEENALLKAQLEAAEKVVEASKVDEALQEMYRGQDSEHQKTGRWSSRHRDKFENYVEGLTDATKEYEKLKAGAGSTIND